MVLTVNHLSKAFGAQIVLDDTSFVINPHERAGLVGLNGVGKSTLLRILIGAEAADGGTFAYAPGIVWGYLPQTTPEFVGKSIDDLIAAALTELQVIAARMAELERDLASCCGDAIDALMVEYGELQARYQERGGYDLDHRIDAVLVGLGLAHLGRDRAVATLSGGERARVGLAALLLRAPDVLLLDEPTNHLDVAALEWLEAFLAAYPGAALIVAHDRQFLNRAVNRIFEIDEHEHHLRVYTGDYDAYLAVKAAERERREEDYARQQEELAELRRRIREADQHVGHHRPPRDRDVSQYKGKGEWVQQAVAGGIRNAQERLARLEADPIAKPPKPLRFRPRFDHDALRSDAIIRATGLGAERGGRWLFRDLHLAIPAAGRIVLTGPNGAGKTTLLRQLLGLEAPDAGTVRRVASARIGYLAQETEIPDLRQTVLGAFLQDHPMPEDQATNALVGSGLFRLEDLAKRLGQLSLGQRRKIAIAGIIAAQPNVLALDEPTNYLSLDVLEAFERAVTHFAGPVIAISHDRWFMRRFGGVVWELRDGVLSQ